MRLPFAAVLLTASLSGAAEKQKIVVTGLVGSDASLQRVAETLSDSLLTELEHTGRVEAIGPGDVTAMLGLERQKALLGCGSESESCLAEITSALGAPWLLTGAVVRMGKTTRVDLKLVRTRDGKVTWRDGRAMTDESEFFDAMAALVRSMVVKNEFGPPQESPAAESRSHVAPWVVVGLGGAALVAGTVFTGLAAGNWSNANDTQWRSSHTFTLVQQEANAFNTNIIVGPTLLGAGAIAVGAGLLWATLSKGDQPPPVAIGFSANGVVVGGAF